MCIYAIMQTSLSFQEEVRAIQTVLPTNARERDTQWQKSSTPHTQVERFESIQKLCPLGVSLLIVLAALGQCCRWLFLYLFREPSILIAVIAMFLEEVGYDVAWSTLLLVFCINLIAIRLMTRLLVDAVCLCLDFFQGFIRGEAVVEWMNEGIVDPLLRVILVLVSQTRSFSHRFVDSCQKA